MLFKRRRRGKCVKSCQVGERKGTKKEADEMEGLRGGAERVREGEEEGF